MQKADLFFAFEWLCDSCGTRNFCSAIFYDQENLNERTAQLDCCNGDPYLPPSIVKCKNCNRIYDVNVVQ